MISGCYYVNNHDSKIVFTRSTAQSYLWNGLKPEDSKDSIFRDGIGFKAIESSVLFFPSWAKHRVQQSDSDELRISIAFNAN